MVQDNVMIYLEREDCRVAMEGLCARAALLSGVGFADPGQGEGCARKKVFATEML